MLRPQEISNNPEIIRRLGVIALNVGLDGGDGHFVAKLRRVKENPNHPKLFTPKQKQDVKLAEELLNSIMKEPWEHDIPKQCIQRFLEKQNKIKKLF